MRGFSDRTPELPAAKWSPGEETRGGSDPKLMKREDTAVANC